MPFVEFRHDVTLENEGGKTRGIGDISLAVHRLQDEDGDLDSDLSLSVRRRDVGNVTSQHSTLNSG